MPNNYFRCSVHRLRLDCCVLYPLHIQEKSRKGIAQCWTNFITDSKTEVWAFFTPKRNMRVKPIGSRSVLPGGSKRPYTSVRKAIMPWPWIGTKAASNSLPLSWHGIFTSCQESEKMSTNFFWWMPLIEVETWRYIITLVVFDEFTVEKCFRPNEICSRTSLTFCSKRVIKTREPCNERTRLSHTAVYYTCNCKPLRLASAARLRNFGSQAESSASSSHSRRGPLRPFSTMTASDDTPSEFHWWDVLVNPNLIYLTSARSIRTSFPVTATDWVW